MYVLSLNKLWDFIQVIYNMREHYTKVEYFSKHILFITIYLLLAKKLNHNNKSMPKTNMNNFVQATEHEVYRYARFEYLYIYRFL
jgi:hypothetical protein